LALAHPEKVRRLILVATSGGIDVEAFGAEDWREDYVSEFPEAASWVTKQRVDLSTELSSIRVPTCLIWATSDPISPVAIGSALAAALPTGVLHVIAGGTHMVARERPGEIRRWSSSTSAQPPKVVEPRVLLRRPGGNVEAASASSAAESAAAVSFSSAAPDLVAADS